MTNADTRMERDGKPLSGRRIVVTRPPGQADSMARLLREFGAEPVSCSTIRIVPPEDAGPLREAARNAGEYAWIVFTSVNGVDRFAAALESEGMAPGEALAPGARYAAIGPSTAERVEERFGVEPDVVPEEYRAEELVLAVRRHAAENAGPSRGGSDRKAQGTSEEASDGTGISAGDGRRELEGQRVLLPRAAEARAVLPEQLEAAGADVDEVAAYRAVPPDEEELSAVRKRLRAGDIDWVTFTASSTVRNFVSLLGADLGGARVAAIGPITAGTARDLGLTVDVVAEEYTVPGLVEAIANAPEGNGREAA